MNVSGVLQKIQLKSPRRRPPVEKDRNNASRNVSDKVQKMKILSPNRRPTKDDTNDRFKRDSASNSTHNGTHTEMLKVTVTMSKLNGIVSDSNVRKPSFGGPLNPFRSSTPINARTGSGIDHLSPLSNSIDTECTFAVVSITHDALGCAEPVVTRFSSQPLQDPSPVVGTKSKFTARWANRIKNAANNSSIPPSLTFPKMMALVEQANSTFQYEPGSVEFSVGIIRQNEMITLGTAKLVITEQMDEVKLRLPLSKADNIKTRNPAMFQSIIKKVKNLNKKNILVDLYEKKQHMSLVKQMPNGIFESRPTHKFTIDDEASLEITVKVSPVNIHDHDHDPDHNYPQGIYDSAIEDDDFTIITAYNSSSTTFPYEEYVIKFKGNSPETPPNVGNFSPKRESELTKKNITEPPSISKNDDSLFSIMSCCFNQTPLDSSTTPDYKVTDESFNGDKRDLALWNEIINRGDAEWNAVDESFTVVSDFKAVSPTRVKTARMGNVTPGNRKTPPRNDDKSFFTSSTQDLSFTSSTQDLSYTSSNWRDDYLSEDDGYTADDTSYSSETNDERTFETGLSALSYMSEYSLGPNAMYSVVHAKKILEEYSKIIGKNPRELVSYHKS